MLLLLLRERVYYRTLSSSCTLKLIWFLSLDKEQRGEARSHTNDAKPNNFGQSASASLEFVPLSLGLMQTRTFSFHKLVIPKWGEKSNVKLTLALNFDISRIYISRWKAIFERAPNQKIIPQETKIPPIINNLDRPLILAFSWKKNEKRRRSK